MTLHSTNALRAINRAAVLTEIARAGSVSRAEISENTELTVAAISRITRELIEAGVVAEADWDNKHKGAGRRTRLLALSATAASLIVMVISANRRAVGIANCRGEIMASIELPDLDLAEAEKSINTFCQTALALIDKTDIDKDKILGVSVVVAVNTNPSTNGRFSSEVLDWKNIPLKSTIETALDLPVHIEARAVALLQSELWNRPGNQQQSIVLINNGWHLGSSVYANGQLLQTDNGRLGQIAHLPVAGTTNTCYCGQRGCLDSVASGAAIVTNLEDMNLMQFDLSQPLNQRLASAINQAGQDPKVAAVFRTAGEQLGDGLTSVIALFSPEYVYIAGNICRQKEYFGGVQSRLQATLRHHNNCKLVVCKVTSIDAAVITGLKAFLLTRNFDIYRLTGKQRLA